MTDIDTNVDLKAGWSMMCRAGQHSLCGAVRCECPCVHARALPGQPAPPVLTLVPRRPVMCSCYSAICGLELDDPRHGSYNGYANLGCRCAACRSANTLAFREKRRRHGVRTRAEYLAEVATGRTHGLRSSYVHGCRCDECREAERTYKATQRKESK